MKENILDRRANTIFWLLLFPSDCATSWNIATVINSLYSTILCETLILPVLVSVIKFCSPIINIQTFKTWWATHLQDAAVLNFFPGCLCNWYFLEYIASALLPGTPSWQHLARQHPLAVSPGYLCLLLSPNLEACFHLYSFLLDQLHAAKRTNATVTTMTRTCNCATTLWHEIGGVDFVNPSLWSSNCIDQ